MKTILIVGDPKDIAQWVCHLEGLNVSVTTTSDEDIALLMVADLKFDVVMADDRKQLLALAQMVQPGIKRVLFTNRGVLDRKIADAILPYPCDRAELRAAVEGLCAETPAAA